MKNIMSTGSRKKRIEEILLVHNEISGRIQGRLDEFRRIWETGDDTALFVELVFCLLTPQSGARRCWQAVEILVKDDCLFGGCFEDICRVLNIVRFKNNKSSYILEARDFFMTKGNSLRRILCDLKDGAGRREWLVKNVKGLGYKEASHFLRNIGLGDSIAILDRHILRSMESLGLIEGIPVSLSPRLYFELEAKLRAFAVRVGIPLDHLDFVLWYMETGDIFK
ncbi:MAG TPA: N-glycosylase/DNA lyase [Spirochaetota bacterium]|nr:N-glycosylase/DNA lyase [Spirochaetota bacterium]HPC40408.1 N-glycosylase/DNA lyase [Spirochaetota bacterium]HPL18781.1 N-glycosylase/DNA lyase [Spirochaetota bacterium]HQF06475.1 N-glycosylase/DNA lyase [Spirochaetota bacterium]HQH98060.1 N-glycosylase/DNA lyase [Spirochaetota bacterium]